MSAINIHRLAVPAVHEPQLREDGFIVHDVAVLKLPHATGTVRRHVGPDGDVMFTDHVESSTEAAWIDDLTGAGDTAEAWAFVVRELDAARAIVAATAPHHQ